MTALIAATWSGNTSWIKRLVNIGADVNLKDDNGTTALMQAVKCCNYAAVQVLLQAGADVEVKDSQGYTSVHWAENPPYRGLLNDNEEDCEKIIDLLRKTKATK